MIWERNGGNITFISKRWKFFIGVLSSYNIPKKENQAKTPGK